MEPTLVLCAGCARHVFADAERCPFCAAHRGPAAPVSLAAAVVVSGALLVGCSGGQQADTQPTAEVPPDATAVAMYGAPAPSSDERIPTPDSSVPVPQPAPTQEGSGPPPAPMYGPPPKQDDDR